MFGQSAGARHSRFFLSVLFQEASWGLVARNCWRGPEAQRMADGWSSPARHSWRLLPLPERGFALPVTAPSATHTPLPSTEEMFPPWGPGTWITFSVGDGPVLQTNAPTWSRLLRGGRTHDRVLAYFVDPCSPWLAMAATGLAGLKRCFPPRRSIRRTLPRRRRQII